jgi:RNA polymerase sigma factor (sigma-70 family)
MESPQDSFDPNNFNAKTHAERNALFEYLHKKCKSNIIKFLKKSGANSTDAEEYFYEGLKDFMAHMFNNNKDLPPEDCEKYLMTICKNLYFNRNQRKISTEQLTDFEIKDNSISISEKSFNIDNMVRKFIDFVKDECKTIILEHFYNKKKHREIASILNMKEETAKKKLQRCLTAMNNLPGFVRIRKEYYEHK